MKLKLSLWVLTETKTKMNSWLNIPSGLEVAFSLYMDNRQTSSREQLMFEKCDLLDCDRAVSADSGKVEQVTQDLKKKND